jgi:hypothetical protein
MSEDELLTVYTLQDAGQAEVIRIALENEGIPCTVGGNRAGLTGILEIDIMVRAPDALRARQLIEAHEISEKPDRDTPDEDFTE